ncbi:hypothetical protein GCM10010210_20830 [Pseudonocardia hydrocarbonoxydans]|uniref:Uncharacterized protein n=2 Tax=Pseudonocardia hydrocarbonoxydans TaxID=76726 RepID=A0A4Y3WT54_9PSEU|nr:hypothetical protein PHY01_43500 [Pseudonocardia hydrocarbonoxydans]
MARKVQQLDNDVQAIYEMLADIQATQKRQHNRLEEIAATQDGHSEVLASHTDVLAGHTDVLAGHTAALADHTATLADHGTKLDRIIALLEQR